MKRFKAYLKQEGEGCDYTIGCGRTVVDIEAESMDEAKEVLKEIIADEYNCDEVMLHSVELMEISSIIDFDIKAFYSLLKKQEDEANGIIAEENERLEYERLKTKFGNAN